MTTIVPNDLLNPTEKTIKNWNCSFIAVEGPNVLDKLSLEDLAIPYESQYRSRVVLKAGETDQPLIYGFIGKAVTFLMVKVTYDSENDPYYQYEEEKYNITYYFENDPVLRPLGRLLIMTGSADNKIPQIYFNNPLDYDVILDVLHATIDAEYSGSTYTGFSMADLSDVLFSGLTSGDTLQYNGFYWTNVTGVTSGDGGTSGSSGTSGTSGFNVSNPLISRVLTSDGTANGAIANSGFTYNSTFSFLTVAPGVSGITNSRSVLSNALLYIRDTGLPLSFARLDYSVGLSLRNLRDVQIVAYDTDSGLTYRNGFRISTNPYSGATGTIFQLFTDGFGQSRDVIAWPSGSGGTTDCRTTFLTPVNINSGLTITGDLIINGTSYSGGTGTSGTSGTSGIDGSSGLMSGATLSSDFYYLSGSSTLYVPNIIATGLTLIDVSTLSGATNYVVTDSNGKIYITETVGITEDVVIGGVTLHFVNGLYTGQS